MSNIRPTYYRPQPVTRRPVVINPAYQKAVASQYPTVKPNLQPGYNRGTPFNENNSLIWVLIVGIVILVGIVIVLIFVNSDNKSKLIKPENCPTIEGNYGTVPNVSPSSLKVVNQCLANSPNGAPGTDPCTFSVSSVYEAITTCDKYSSNVCNGFYYNATNKSMSFYITGFEPQSETTYSATNVDVYTRQV